MKSPINSKAARCWLESLLRDRYGLDLELEIDNGNYVLSLRGGSAEPAIYIPIIECFYSESSATIPCSEYLLNTWQDDLPSVQSLVSPGISAPVYPLVEMFSNRTVLRYDALGLAYWALNRWEEYAVGDEWRDEHNRFPYSASHACKFDYGDRPVVDEWFVILGAVIQKTWPNVSLKKHYYSVSLSHDVDRPSRYGYTTTLAYFMAVGGDLLHRRYPIATIARSPSMRIKSRLNLSPLDPYNTFDFLMDSAEELGLAATFNFFGGGSDVKFDANYHLNFPSMRKLIQSISTRGHHIGLHPSYQSGVSELKISSELESLRRACKSLGVREEISSARMHYLRLNIPETWVRLEETGIEVDTSLAYAERPGFRCGSCYKYKPFNILSGKSMDIEIQPLVAMDSSLFNEKYLGYTYAEAVEKVSEYIERCRSVSGCFSLLWHNSTLNNDELKSVYRNIVGIAGAKA